MGSGVVNSLDFSGFAFPSTELVRMLSARRQAPTLSSWQRIAVDLPRIVMPLASFAAIVVLSGFEVDPQAAAETGYLGRLVVAVLLAVGALAPAPARSLSLGAVLAVLAVWTLPAGPLRGSVVVAVLVVALGFAAVRRLRLELGREGGELPAGVAVALAFGCQALVRGRLLLPEALNGKELVALLVLPAVAGVAVAVAARGGRGREAALVLVAVPLLGPGWNVAATLAVVALGAGRILGERFQPLWIRSGAAVVMLAPLVWDWRAGLVAGSLGLALGFPWAGALVGMAVVVVFGALNVWVGGSGFAAAYALPLALPLLPLGFRKGALPMLTALLLAGAAAWGVLGPSALAAPIAFAALAVPLAAPAFRVQAAWSSGLFGVVALLSAYPWLREFPLTTVSDGLGLRGMALTGGLILLVGLIASFPTRNSKRRSLVGLAGALIAGFGLAAAVSFSSKTGQPLLLAEQQLTLESPAWQSSLALSPKKDSEPLSSLLVPRVEAIVIDSNLANGAALVPGTPVAIVRLVEPGARRSWRWTLRAGRDTAEWAAGRADLRGSIVAPAPWLSWVAGDFFAQRYRAVLPLAQPSDGFEVRIERAPELPPDVRLVLYQVRVRGRVASVFSPQGVKP